jgi:uncharacterized membrane protein YdbT with pleckstrin-like domain
MSPFATYLIGFSIVLAGLAIAAHLLGVTTLWILIAVVVVVGAGVILARRRSRTRGQQRV